MKCGVCHGAGATAEGYCDECQGTGRQIEAKPTARGSRVKKIAKVVGIVLAGIALYVFFVWWSIR